MVTIQAQLVGYIAHKALAIVAFVIAGHIEAVLDQLVLQAAQAHTGSHAVTDGDIQKVLSRGLLGRFSGLGGFGSLLGLSGLCRGFFRLSFRGRRCFRLCFFLRFGLLDSGRQGVGLRGQRSLGSKGRHRHGKQQPGGNQQACNAFCFHGHHSLFPRNISRLRNCFHDKEMKGECQLTKRGKSQEKVVKIEAFEAECRK